VSQKHPYATKTLDHLEWTALQGVSRPKVLELASCEYLRKSEDVVVVGPVGTGKTHLSIGLGVEATRRRYRVWFTRAATLVRSLMEARDERTLGRVQQRLVKVDLLIVDELGFVPFERTGGRVALSHPGRTPRPTLHGYYEQSRLWRMGPGVWG